MVKKKLGLSIIYIGLIVALIFVNYDTALIGLDFPYWIESGLTVILVGFAFSLVVLKRRKKGNLSTYAKFEPYLIGLLALIVIGITFAEQF